MPRDRLSRTTLAAAVCVGSTLWLSFGILAVTDADRVRRIGLLPPVWLLVALVTAAIVIAAAARLSSRTSLPLFLSLLIALPWIPLRVPDLFLALTGPAVLFVWGAIALGLLVILASRQPAARFSIAVDPRKAPLLAAALAFVTFLGVWTGQFRPPTGDEPHYLVMTQSLLLDHDLKVANNYERGDYSAYYGGPLGPQPSPPGINGEQLSNHAPGLAVLIAPAFAVGGYWAVVVLIAALTAIGTALVWKGGYLLTDDPRAAWFAWASVALTVPVALHGSLVYPDPIAGVILAGGALALVVVNDRRRVETTVREQRQSPPWPAWGSLGLGTATALLPWLHTRLALPAGILVALLALHIGTDPSFATGRRRHLLMFSAPVVLFVAGWLAFFRASYGTFSPVAAYGDQIPLDLRQIASGALGLLADQSFGLIPHAPVHLLWLVGLWAVFRKSLRLGFELVLLTAPYAMTSSAFGMWWAGNSSPARFLVPIVFPLGIAVAGAWAWQSQRGRAISVTLLGASVMIATALAFGGGGRLPYNDAMGRARWLDWTAPLVDLPRGFPSFFREAATVGGSHALIPAELAWPALFWAGSILAGCIVFVALDRWLRATIPVRALTAPACVVLVCALGTAMTWSNASGSTITATRAQLEMLRNQNPRRLPVGVQLVPMRALGAADIPARLAIATSPLDTPSPGTLLYLEEVPSGTYRIQVTRRPLAAGELALGIGKASVPTERWPLTTDQQPFYLPVHTSMISVTGDADAIRSVSKVALVPVPGTSAPVLSDARARDAVRYGPMVVFTLDDRVSLEPKGFWVMGETQPEVVVTIDQPVDSLELDIRNGPGANRVRVWSGAWSTARELTPDEAWRVRVPVPGRARAIAVGFDVQRGFIPARTDPTSVDHRSLGCWVEVR